MEKNITVVDEVGNILGATYEKRARGLIKNGRARYIDEHTICLACPPKSDLEDIMMNEHKSVINETIEKEMQPESCPYTVSYILGQLEQITADTGYIYEALSKLDHTSAGSLGLGIGNVIEQREKTNRQLIAFYTKLYCDLTGTKMETESSARTAAVNRILDAIDNTDDPDKFDALTTLLREMLK